MTFMRPVDVQRKMKVSRTHLYELIRQGLFPKPVKPFKKMSLWNEAEVDRIMEAFYKRIDKEKIKELVNEIEQLRSN
ncbi:MAG TPA: AlpA family phage regulatory protein [Syntrophorhabdaceae bacterium]|nr:AlpA family phage regulatory protein [Syntrophorhabdaceae bacterium]HQM81219.1 AlpA family phage regulatory protein [Syntrophorhabdaceae bacterium]